MTNENLKEREIKMLLNWKKAESLELPLEVDCTLSDKAVYYRKNIEQVATDDGFKYVYDEAVLSNDFRFPILDMEEYKAAIEQKIAEINSRLHITKLDFYNNFCKPAGISYEVLMAKITELNMQAEWEFCNHVYYGIIKPFLTTLPLGKTEEEIIALFEQIMQQAE